MTITVKQATFGDIVFVLEHLRDADARELAAMECDKTQLPRMIMEGNVFAFTATDESRKPCAVWGMLHTRKGVGAGFAFGTDQWGRALMAMVHNMRQFVLPTLLLVGYHRVECAAMAHREDIARFLALIGARPEAFMHQTGANGEDFVLYRWLADEYRSAREAPRHVSH